MFYISEVINRLNNAPPSSYFNGYNDIIRDFISSTASDKNNASRKAEKSSYIQLSKMKEDLRKIIGEVFFRHYDPSNIVYDNTRGLTYAEKIRSAKSSNTIFLDGKNAIKDSIEFELFLLLDNISCPQDYYSFMSIIRDSYKGDHISSSIKHNICHTKIWNSAVVFQSMNKFILLVTSLMKNKKIIRDAVCDFFMEQALDTEVNLLKWKVSRCCQQYVFFMAIYLVKKIGLYPVIQGITWKLEVGGSAKQHELGNYNIFMLLLNLLNMRLGNTEDEDIMDEETDVEIQTPKSLLVELVVHPFLIRLVNDSIELDDSSVLSKAMFPVTFKEFIEYECSNDTKEFFDKVTSLHSKAIHLFWLPLLGDSCGNIKKRKREKSSGREEKDSTREKPSGREEKDSTDTKIPDTNGFKNPEDPAINTLFNGKNNCLSDADQDNATRQILSEMIREQPLIGNNVVGNNDQHEGLSKAEVIVEDKFNPTWEDCLLSFDTIRTYMEAHDMTSIIDSFDAVVDSIVKERRIMDEMLNNYLSNCSS